MTVGLIVEGLVALGLISATVAIVVSDRATRRLLREVRRLQTQVLDHH